MISYNNFNLNDAERVLTKPKGWWAAIALLFWAKRIALFIVNRTRFTANHVTYFAFAVCLASALAFYKGTHTFLIVGAVLFELNYLLDCVDGTVARLKNESSPEGSVIDASLDLWRIPICVIGLTFAHFRVHGDPTIFLLGILYTAIKLIHIYSCRSQIGIKIKHGRSIIESSFIDPPTNTIYGKWKRYLNKKNLAPYPRSPETDVLVFFIGPIFNQLYWGFAAGLVMHVAVWICEEILFLKNIRSSSQEKQIIGYIDKHQVKKIAAFGSGLAAANFASWWEQSGLETAIEYFVDNNSSRHGKKLFGRPIYSPDQLHTDKPDLVVVTSKDGRYEISNQLEEMGMKENEDYIYANFSR